MDASGNVGIGTTTPLAKLEVKDTNGGTLQFSPSDGAVEIASGNDTYAFIDFKGSANLASDWMGRIGHIDGTGFDFNTGGSTRMVVGSDGNVGIGVSTPGALLQMSKDQDALTYMDLYNVSTGNSAGAIMRLITQNVAASGVTSVDIVKYRTGAFVLNNNDTNAAAFTSFGVGSSERMRINSSGNVGIGTTSPGAPLHVNKVGVVTSSWMTPSLLLGDLTSYGSASDTALSGVIGFNGAAWANGYIGYYPHKTDGRGYFRITGAGSAYGDTPVGLLIDGNVGVGTTSPDDTLDIRGNLKIGSASGTGILAFGDIGSAASSAGAGLYIGRGIDSSSILSVGGFGGINFHTLDTPGGLGTAKMVLTSGGSVGVGTTNPTNLLHIEGAAAPASGISGINLKTTTDYVGIVLDGGTAGTTKSLGIHYGDHSPYGTPNDLRFGRYDNNLGIWEANPIRFNMNAPDSSLVMNSLGNVGVGTTSPEAKLHVSGGYVLLDNTNKIQFKDTGGTVRDALTFWSDNLLYVDGSQGLRFRTNNTTVQAMAIDNSGNVGVGTTSPSQKLHVVGWSVFGTTHNTGGAVTIEANHPSSGANGNDARITTQNDLDFFLDNASRLHVKNSGNVGIGTTNPGAPLEVQKTNAVGKVLSLADSAAATYSDATPNGFMSLYARFTGESADWEAGRIKWGYVNTYGNNGARIGFDVINNVGAYSNAMTITGAGNVGIGTTAPASRLSVWGSNVAVEPHAATIAVGRRPDGATATLGL